MNISENKRVIGISALFLIAFGGLMYVGYSASSEASVCEEELLKISDKNKKYSSAEISPTPGNVKRLEEIAKTLSSERKAAAEEFDAYRRHCIKCSAVDKGTDYQTLLLTDRGAYQALAKEKGCQLNGNTGDYSLPQNHFNGQPERSRLPVLSFQHHVLHDLLTGMINDGIKAVDGIYIAPAPVNTYEDGDDEWNYEPLSFEIDIRVPRGVLPKVLNRLVNDRQYLVTLTGISVSNKSPLDPLDAVAPTVMDADGNVPATAPDKEIAVIKAGRPDETVYVHLNLSVLYFNNKAQ
ncbi:MAG TPA: Amuc_1100 family pilus-like protein [Candidatus Akkermansia intestinigallinarum]|uniref:Amuc_1100 family pilus-like protein n=1 Tax=Candidatus Akkermansia intestinigallinarum TaxID=2838431 RepID=A0A9D2AHD3_9BACT|nr:Amuc_1100 family pilus-like protein [Candidatus Akkermansia intestinigallinarum]